MDEFSERARHAGTLAPLRPPPAGMLGAVTHRQAHWRTDELTDLNRLHAVRRDLTRRLTAWGAFSVAAGGAMSVVATRRGEPLLAGVARQFLAWGAIDLVIAGVGAAANRRPVTDATGALRSLRRLLVVNAVLDVGYLVGAAVLARSPGRRGDAAGVAVQGLALLVLDVGQARRIGAPNRR